MCSCIEDVDKQLADHNAWLIATIFDPRRVVIGTCKRDEKKRGKIPSMLASFCPFCGEEYAASGRVEAIAAQRAV